MDFTAPNWSCESKSIWEASRELQFEIASRFASLSDLKLEFIDDAIVKVTQSLYERFEKSTMMESLIRRSIAVRIGALLQGLPANFRKDDLDRTRWKKSLKAEESLFEFAMGTQHDVSTLK